MRKLYPFLNVAGILLITVLISCCSKDEEEQTSDDPYNLSVEVVSVDNQTGYSVIKATAENTVEYQFYVEPFDQLIDKNETGDFEYTFEGDGDHEFEVRAYGSSGKYIRERDIVSISSGSNPDPIPVDSGYFSAEQYEGYTRIWEDEFSGTSVNTNYWNYDIGNGNWGWGNNELEYYRVNNSWLEGGTLIIEAREESYSNYNYTSSKLHSKGKFSFKYGRVDIRALLPVGQGLWPALWMLGSNINTVGWPACGETDIMEMVGGSGRENTIHGTLHWDEGYHASEGGSKTLPSGTYADEYHVFSIIWDENSIKFLMNDQQYKELAITSGGMTEFHKEFYFILNVAVGGNWPGNPDNTTVFPQQMRVDYIRVFQKNK